MKTQNKENNKKIKGEGMKVIKVLRKYEIKLLEEVNIHIEDRKYSYDEIDKIIEDLDMVISNNLDKNENFTPKALDYERIQDKLLDLENMG